jgi:NAD(P)-dependent dehydrogenase (short-subunit alcohol dehydrogenase family)
MIVEGKTIAVSGVGPGLGSEIVAAALRDGANVVLGARNADRLDEVAAALDPGGAHTLAQRLDICDADTCAEWFDAAAERFGSIDAVVNVAAIDYLPGGLLDSDLDSWRAATETNIIGTIQLLRAGVPHLRDAGGGAIVLVGSQSYTLPPDMPMAPYASSKAALESLQRAMVGELGPDRIRVNTVHPTWMWGPPVQMYVDFTSAARKVDREVVIEELRSKFPLGEIPADDDVAEAVLFLCSDRARMITGQNLFVNAGEHMP